MCVCVIERDRIDWMLQLQAIAKVEILSRAACRNYYESRVNKISSGVIFVWKSSAWCNCFSTVLPNLQLLNEWICNILIPALIISITKLGYISRRKKKHRHIKPQNFPFLKNLFLYLVTIYKTKNQNVIRSKFRNDNVSCNLSLKKHPSLLSPQSTVCSVFNRNISNDIKF